MWFEWMHPDVINQYIQLLQAEFMNNSNRESLAFDLDFADTVRLWLKVWFVSSHYHFSSRIRRYPSFGCSRQVHRIDFSPQAAVNGQ
jgi:hypothetical protein